MGNRQRAKLEVGEGKGEIYRRRRGGGENRKKQKRRKEEEITMGGKGERVRVVRERKRTRRTGSRSRSVQSSPIEDALGNCTVIMPEWNRGRDVQDG